MPPFDDRFDFHSVPAADSKNQTAAQKADQAVELLRRESRIHQQQSEETGLIGRAVAGATEFFHKSGSIGADVDDLRQKIQADVAAGKVGEAANLARGAAKLVDADQAALKTRGEIAGFGSGVVQAAGLFMGGRRGLILAGGAAALDAIKPGSKDSFGEQAADVGLGVGKAMALKGAFALAGKFNLGMATTAVGLGFTSRVTDLSLSRKTYLDSHTGKYIAGLGGERVWAGVTDKAALATDVASFLLAKGTIGKLNAATDGALTSNTVLSKSVVGGIFGITQSAVTEAVRQHDQGVFEPGQFAQRTLTSGLASMTGAALGGRFSPRALAIESPLISSAKLEAPAGFSDRLVQSGLKISDAKPNFLGSKAREYQLVAPDLDVAGTMAKSKGNYVMARVQEVGPDGQVSGSAKNLLIHHNGDGIPVDPELVAKADAVAMCDPASLPPAWRAKHIMPSVQESLWLSQSKGGRLSFSETLAKGLTPGEPQPVALGNRTVSELLKDPTTLDKIYAQPNPHDLGLYSQVLKGFKVPARQVLVGGADSLVVDLADDTILKITHQQWNPEWGHRKYEDAQGKMHTFDARMLSEPQKFDSPYGSVTYFTQERATTPITESGVYIFADKLEKGSIYRFWDRDATQLGIVLRKGKPVVRLLDYDAVRPQHLVPRDLKVPHEDRFDRDDRFGRGDDYEWEDRFDR